MKTELILKISILETKLEIYLIKKKNYLDLNNYYKSLSNISSIDSVLMSFMTITKDSIDIEKVLFNQLPLIIKKHLLYKVFLMMSPIDTIRSKNIENTLSNHLKIQQFK